MLDLTAIKAREAMATPGPWYTRPSGEREHGFSVDVAVAGTPGRQGIYVRRPKGGTFPAADQKFIANARTDIPALVKEVEDLREVLERLGWIGATRWCPSCGKFEHEGHAKHCELARLLGRGE